MLSFTLSDSQPWNSTYSTDDGRVVYKVVSPYQFVGQRATIFRCIDSEGHLPFLPKHGSPENDSDSLDSLDELAIPKSKLLAGVEERFGYLAVVKFNIMASSKFRFCGGEVKTKHYFRLGKRGWNGRDHIFTGPDGREYRWVLGVDTPILYLNDNPSIIVARYHRKWELPWQTPPARLEVSSIGEAIVDTIIMTLVYIEHLRLARERAKHH